MWPHRGHESPQLVYTEWHLAHGLAQVSLGYQTVRFALLHPARNDGRIGASFKGTPVLVQPVIAVRS